MSFDPGTRGLATQARNVTTARAIRNLGNIGTRLFGGRLSNTFNNTAQFTFETTLALVAPFDAVRLVFAAGQTNSATGVSATMLATVAVVGDTSDATINGATWTGAQVAGSGTWALAPSSAFGRSKIVVSDWITLPSVARTDGGALPLLVVRAWVNGGNPIVLYGDGTQSFTNWGAHPSGRIWRVRTKSGNYASTSQSGFTAPAVSSTGPLIGVQYLARGKVVTLWGFGDSITEGQGTYIGEGFGAPAAVALSANPAGVAYEWAQAGWSGGSMVVINNRVTDFAASGLLDLGTNIAVLPGGSPNDNVSTVPTTGAGSPTSQRGYLAQMLLTLAAKKVQPVLWTWLPTNASVRPYGATDAVRRAYNDELRGWSGRGQVVADFDKVIAGATNGSGQVEMATGTSGDGIHPGDSGNGRFVPLLSGCVQQIVPLAAGVLTA